jgi:hypothetical protein
MGCSVEYRHDCRDPIVMETVAEQTAGRPARKGVERRSRLVEVHHQDVSGCS